MSNDSNQITRKRKSDVEVVSLVTSAVTVMTAGIAAIEVVLESMRYVDRAPRVNRNNERERYIESIIYESDEKCLDNIRMTRGAFHKLCDLMKNQQLLRSTLDVSVEEQLVMFLHIIGHNVRLRVIRGRFFRSTETIHRYFTIVLSAILKLQKHFIVPPDCSTPPEIQYNPRYWPWFKDCIGAIDGTHVRASVPVEMQARFRGRKEKTTQNVLATISFDLKFTYVLAGWEGSANDPVILEDALTRRNGLTVPEGKYFLADAGFGIRSGFIPPYRAVRYHLKEYSNHSPENEKELFNLRHSSLRTSVERAFGVLKKRWRVLDAEPFWSYQTQVDVVLACCIMHNHIMKVNPRDRFMVEVEDEQQTLIDDPQAETQTQRRQRTQREERNENREWTTKRDFIANSMFNAYNNN